jgi:hypothetical protein
MCFECCFLRRTCMHIFSCTSVSVLVCASRLPLQRACMPSRAHTLGARSRLVSVHARARKLIERAHPLCERACTACTHARFAQKRACVSGPDNISNKDCQVYQPPPALNRLTVYCRIHIFIYLVDEINEGKYLTLPGVCQYLQSDEIYSPKILINRSW